MSNVLVALRNLVENPRTDVVAHYRSSNRANSAGDALESYVKDLFCGTVGLANNTERAKAYERVFSYLGNQNNPPDAMIREGDAIEIKKLENLRSGIALNSSYPKDKLYSDSPMITQSCRDAEPWEEKDILYVVGVTGENTLKALWFVYGDCYAAGKEVYERIATKISAGLRELTDVEFADTKELGRVNRVDPLGITYLRIRGMWHIENPVKFFEHLAEGEANGALVVRALMLRTKYESFPEGDRVALEGLAERGVTIQDVHIKSPQNPVQMLDAKLIMFTQ